MTAQHFRKLALAQDGAVEGEHMGHADFRLHGKIFATVGYPDDQHGMVKLPLEKQQLLLHSAPEIFAPATGAWGRAGSTLIRLSAVSEEQATEALVTAAQMAAALRRAPRRRATRSS